METSHDGVVYFGHVFSCTGYGTAARAYIHTLHQASVPVSVIDLDPSLPKFVPDSFVISCQDRPIDPTLLLCHAIPSEIAPFKDLFPRLVVLTTWETDILPQSHIDLLNQVLEVWVPSGFNLSAFRRQLKTPVFQIPHPVHRPRPACFSRIEINRQLGLSEDSFVFLSTGTWQERKNLPGVIEAFFRAFPDEPNAILFLKTFFNFTDINTVRSQIFKAIQRAGVANPHKTAARVRVCSVFWPEECVTALAQRADCYVSLHCGEGWCYPLFDAACNGTPVIATGYSGPMDYLDARYHHLVRYDLVPAARQRRTTNFAFNSHMMWAAPDVVHAAALMREVYEQRHQAMEQAAQGALLLKQKYAPEVIGRMVKMRLDAHAEDRYLVA